MKSHLNNTLFTCIYSSHTCSFIIIQKYKFAPKTVPCRVEQTQGVVGSIVGHIVERVSLFVLLVDEQKRSFLV
jgi:hypothetical protein